MNGQPVNCPPPIPSVFPNAFVFPFIGFSGSPNEDDRNKVKETKGRRVNRKPRRKFTKDELYLLNHIFEDTPYPDFITRKKLAERLCCQIYAIDVSEISRALLYILQIIWRM